METWAIKPGCSQQNNCGSVKGEEIIIDLPELNAMRGTGIHRGDYLLPAYATTSDYTRS